MMGFEKQRSDFHRRAVAAKEEIARRVVAAGLNLSAVFIKDKMELRGTTLFYEYWPEPREDGGAS